MSTSSLTRSSSEKILGGVCGGLARYLNVDVALVRVVMALVVFFTGIGPLVYIALWLLLPLDSGERPLAEDFAGKAQTWVKEQQEKKNPTEPSQNGWANPTDTNDQQF